MKKILTLCLALCLALSLAACDSGQESTSSTAGADTLYTVSVMSNAGVAMSGLKYYVYKDATLQTGLLAYGVLDSSGIISFTAPQSDAYTLVLEGVEEGYDLQSSYPLPQAQTQVVLSSTLILDQEATAKAYRLGDIMRDFTVTDVDGNRYQLSELLKTKKCVVLNFWNIKCSPCKMEFPFLQQAYEAYADDIALIAMDPVKGDTEDGVRQFRQDNGLSFPMALCDEAWVNAMAPNGNPTTVIIDRYGKICVLETGAVTEEGIFEAIFQHFTAEDYQQQEIRNMEDFVMRRSRG